MKNLLITGLLFFVFQIYSCEEGSMRTITTDHNGYAEEYMKIPANGKIKIVDIDANCAEIERAGKFYKTRYIFTLRELTVILDCTCDQFKSTEYFNVTKDDKIKLSIRNGEAETRYKIKYDFVETK
jgi:hypothetical protein